MAVVNTWPLAAGLAAGWVITAVNAAVIMWR